jgi:SAM-dependent methyltransferase
MKVSSDRPLVSAQAITNRPSERCSSMAPIPTASGAELQIPGEVTTCPVCHGESRSYGVPVGLLCRCVACKLLFRHRQPTNGELQALYAASWSAPKRNTAETGSIDSHLAAQYVRLLTEAVGRARIEGAKLLDVGAGDGTVSATLREAGAKVWAVEPYGYEYVQRQGIPVFHELDEVPTSIGFDGIILMNVLEHVQNPQVFLRQLHDRLWRGGWLFVATPNAAGLNARIFGTRWREARNKAHLHLFTPCNFEALLIKCGFSVHRRLRWRVRYDYGPLRNLAGACLRRLELDGELRYLAFKQASSRGQYLLASEPTVGIHGAVRS